MFIYGLRILVISSPHFFSLYSLQCLSIACSLPLPHFVCNFLYMQAKQWSTILFTLHLASTTRFQGKANSFVFKLLHRVAFVLEIFIIFISFIHQQPVCFCATQEKIKIQQNRILQKLNIYISMCMTTHAMQIGCLKYPFKIERKEF